MYDEEAAGCFLVQKVLLEESLDNELEKMGEDDTSRISPVETLMTKNPGERERGILDKTSV